MVEGFTFYLIIYIVSSISSIYIFNKYFKFNIIKYVNLNVILLILY